MDEKYFEKSKLLYKNKNIKETDLEKNNKEAKK